MNNQQRAIDLIISRLLSNITPDQEIELDNWTNASEANKRLYDRLLKGDSLLDKHASYEGINTDAAYRNFLSQIEQKAPKRKSFARYAGYAAAAVFLLFVISGVYFTLTQRTPLEGTYTNLKEIANRQDQAILILDNGTQIDLNSAGSTGQIQLSASSSATNAGSKIDYTASASSGEDVYNTLLTPKGKEYTVILSDGTSVHLNSSSRLKYPVSFRSDRREVTLEGEGYFSVTKDSKRPFIVNAKGLQIRQYGTVFNINTHPVTANVEVVLVEGSIGVNTPNSGQAMIKPSQLAEYNPDNSSLSVKHVDIESYISWHRGELVFEDKSLKEIMHTLSMWYGVDIIIDNKEIEKLHFTGKMTRYDKIDMILRSIENSADVKFSVVDNQVHVTKPLK